MANEENTVLIVGATGTVGGEAVRATLARGGKVRALVRSAERALQLAPQVDAMVGDLRDASAVDRALRGVGAALYVSPHEPDEETLGEQFVRSCEHAGARLVFVGVHVDGRSRVSRALQRFLYGRVAPHYRPKFRIAERARVSRTRPIVLMPTNYYQNDELFREAILRGEFPTTFDRGVNRVDVRDLGEAIARALLDHSLPSGAYPVRGPASLSSDECAAIWTSALGREVRCIRDTRRLEAALTALPAKKRNDFVQTYEVLRGFALPTTLSEVEGTAALIGHAPVAYEKYVRDALARWTQSASNAIAQSA